jgi:polyhydroxybutyrate depolymerase
VSRPAPNRVAPRRRASAVPFPLPLPRARRRQITPRRIPRHTALIACLGVLAAVGVCLPIALSATASPAVSATEVTSDGGAVLPPAVPASPPAVPVVQPGPGTPRGDSRHITLEVGGLERGYFLLPALGLAPGQEAALLVVLHQDVSSGREIAVDLGLDDLRRHGITLAYPNGFGGSWNSGACCGIAAEQDVDDVGFVNTVLEDVGRHTPIDPERRALLGYSGGGMLAYRLMCREHPPLVAVVEISGSLESHCANGLTLPDLLAVHGQKDGSVGLTESRYVNHLHMAPRSVVSTLATVTGQAGCGERVTSTANGIELWSYDGCRGGGTVEVQVVPGAGHGWADVGGAARASAWLLPRLTQG